MASGGGETVCLVGGGDGWLGWFGGGGVLVLLVEGNLGGAGVCLTFCVAFCLFIKETGKTFRTYKMFCALIACIF